MTKPFDMDHAIDVTCQTMAELTTLIEAENQALEERQLHAIKDLVDRKQRLARNLEVLLSGLHGQKERFDLFAEERPDAREKLRDHWDRLNSRTAHNAEILKRTLDLAQNAMNVIVEEVRRAHQENGRYDARSSRSGKGPGSRRPDGLSVSLNTTV